MVEDNQMPRNGAENSTHHTPEALNFSLDPQGGLELQGKTDPITASVNKDHELVDVQRTDREDQGSALAQLHTLNKLLSREQHKSRLDVDQMIATPEGRAKLIAICERMIHLFESIPGYLETRFTSLLRRPKEQAAKEKLFDMTVNQVPVLSQARQRAQIIDALAIMRAEATTKSRKDEKQRSSMLRRALKPLYRVAAAATVAGLFASGAAASAQEPRGIKPVNKIGMSPNSTMAGLEARSDADSFESELSDLFEDIGGIADFIAELKATLGSRGAEPAEAQVINNQVETQGPDAPEFQQPQPTPTQELEITASPTSNANVRSRPSTDSDIDGEVTPGSIIRILSKVIENGQVWYETIASNGKRGWIRGDLVTNLSQEVPDVTLASKIPLDGTDVSLINYLGENEGAEIDLVKIQESFKLFLDAGWPVETFTPENLRVLDRENGRVFIQINQVGGNEAGSIITITTGIDANGNNLLAPGFYGPDQYRDELTLAGIAGLESAYFTSHNTPRGFVRFGGNVLLNYDQATLALLAGTSQVEALLENSIVLNEGTFPEAEFTTDGEFITFATGERFELFINGATIGARRVEGVPNPQDAILNPNLSEIFGTNIPNDVLLRVYNPIVGGYAAESNGELRVYREIVGEDVEVTDQLMAGNIPVTLECIDDKECVTFTDNIDIYGAAGFRQIYIEAYKKQFEVDELSAIQMLNNDTELTLHVITDARDFANSKRMNSNNSVEMKVKPSSGISILFTRDFPQVPTADNIAFNNTFATLAWGSSEDGSGNPIISFGYAVRATEQGRIVLIVGTQASEINDLSRSSLLMYAMDHLIRSIGNQSGSDAAMPNPPHRTNYVKASESTHIIGDAFNFPFSEESRSFSLDEWNSRNLVQATN